MDRLLPTCLPWHRFLAALLMGVAAGFAAFGQETTEGDEEEEPEVIKQLVFIEEHFDIDDGGSIAALKSPYDVKVSPDGKHVYVASQADDAVTFFGRNAADGTLQFAGDVDELELGTNTLNGVRTIAISPDGAFVYVASMFAGTSPTLGGNLLSFRRDETSGGLALIGSIYDTDPGVDGLNGARSVAISPDGKNLYVSAFDGNGKLSVFSRNSVTGMVTFLGVYQEGDQDVAELTEPHAVTVSPDGKNVYVALWQNVIVNFTRNATNGLLTYQSKIEYLVAQQSVSGAGSSRAIVVSPDGKFVYVASRNTDAITVFTRDAATGALEIKGNVFNLADGVKDMDSPQSMVVSADGAYIYVASFSSDSVVSFKRDATEGTLSYFQSILSGEDDTWSMNGPLCLAASPDGEHVYVGSGSGDHSLTVFRREVIVDPPEMVVQPVSTSIEEGKSVAFHALAQGVDVTYQWSRNDVPISGATMPVLTLNNVSSSLNNSVYKVKASNPGGSISSSSATLTVLPPVVIEPPADLTALDVSSNSVRLSWTDQSDNETNFEVQRRVVGGQFSPIATVLANQSQYTDATISSSTTYRYRVVAKRNEDASLWSNEAVVESFDDIPQAPVNLELVEQDYNRVALAWRDRSAVEDGFRVQRRRDEIGANWETVGKTDANANRYTDRTVPPNATFAYRVQAYNESGSSEFTNSVVGITSSIPVDSISPLSRSIPKEAASGYSISVTSTKAWEAIPDVAWLQVTSPSQGKGTGNQSVTYKASLNESQSERIGKVVVGGIEHTVAQAGSPPFLRIQPARTEVAGSGGTALVEIQSNVAWTATESSDWLSITSGSAGSNYGTVVLSVSPNPSFDARIATLQINDRTHEIEQAGASRILSLQSATTSFTTAGGQGTVSITSNIEWAASVSESWIQLTAPATGDGSATLSFSVDENISFEPRVADITVNKKAISIAQQALVLSDIPQPKLTGIDVSSGLGARVTWSDNSITETGFFLRRSVVGSEKVTTVAILEPNATSYFDRDAPRGKSVEYRLAALDTVGRSAEDVMASSPLPDSNLTMLVTRAELGGSAPVVFTNFALAGDGQVTLSCEGFGPALGSLPHGLPDRSCSLQLGGDIGKPASVGVMDPVDWASRVDLAAIAFGAGSSKGFDAQREGIVYGILARAGEDAFPRGASARGYIADSDATIVAAFEIEGEISLPVLIRATGPGLSRQGVTDVLVNPRLDLYRIEPDTGALTLLFANDDWGSWTGGASITLADALGKAGLPALESGSKEAQILTDLPPGRYACALRHSTASYAGAAALQIYDAR